MLKELLEKYNLKLAVAESLTGGKLSAKICEEPGISSVYLGSVTSYTDEIKSKVLNVDSDFLVRYGPYNSQTTRQMCDGLLELTGANIAVAISGVAGPGSNRGTPAGKFYVSLLIKKYNNMTQAGGFEYQIFNDDREKVREYAAQMAYDYLISYLLTNEIY